MALAAPLAQTLRAKLRVLAAARCRRTYRVLAMTRNAANVGSTDLLFYDAGEQQIGAQQTNWQSDAWQYHANPAVTAVAPAGSQALRVRFALATPSEYADIDLVQVHLEPL
ncbi:MAG: hypothetical protein U0263_16700 [Polyangiaceae bacterium]